MNIISNDKSKKVIGYKEIRYFNQIALIDEFIELFPNTKVICHISDDIDRQCKSGWWKESDKESLIKQSNQYMEYCTNNQNCYLSYMKYLFDIDEVKKIFLFLGEKLDEDKYYHIINNKLE